MTKVGAARSALGILLLVSASALAAQTRPLNPTVKVLDRTGEAAMKAECEQALAPQRPPRVEVTDVAQPKVTPKKPAEAPPSKSLRAQLAQVQEAAVRGDRSAFRDALARVNATLETYPRGGERDAAAAALRVYNDLDRIWTYEFDSKTGAFFDASTGLVDVMSAYPGWTSFIAKQTVTAGGTKLYPSRESRDFLVREAAKRLAKLGITVSVKTPERGIAPRIAEAEPRAAKRVQQKAVEPSHETVKAHTSARKTKSVATTAAPKRKATATSKKHERTVAAERKTTKRAPKKEVVKTAEATPVTPPAAPQEKKTESAPSTAPAGSMFSPSAPATESASPVAALTHEAETTSSNASTSSATGAAIPSATTSTSATSSTWTGPAASTASSSTETTATESTGTTGTQEPQQRQQGRNVILPVILIVVGLGVLIALFRASS